MSGCKRDLLQSPRVMSVLSSYLQDSFHDFLLLLNASLCLVALVTEKKSHTTKRSRYWIQEIREVCRIWRLMGGPGEKNVFEWQELNWLH